MRCPNFSPLPPRLLPTCPHSGSILDLLYDHSSIHFYSKLVNIYRHKLTLSPRQKYCRLLSTWCDWHCHARQFLLATALLNMCEQVNYPHFLILCSLPSRLAHRRKPLTCYCRPLQAFPKTPSSRSTCSTWPAPPAMTSPSPTSSALSLSWSSSPARTW